MATKAKKKTSTKTVTAAKNAAPKLVKPAASASPALEAAVKKVATAPSRSDGDEAAKLSGVTRATTAASINKKELVTRVAKRANLRPNQVRDVTLAVLEELGVALVKGEELKLPGLGKMQVKRKKDLGGAEVMICKLRRKKDENSDVDPLAPAAE